MKKLMLSLVVLAMSAATAFAQCPTQGKKCDAAKACPEKAAKFGNRLAQELKLDDATAAWFQPLFAEYVQKMKDTREKYSCKKDKKAACTDAEIMKNLENQIKCQEELAITLSVGDVFMDVVHEYPDLTVHLTLFNATIAEGEPQKLEHNDIQWITPSEIPNYEFCPADEEILAKICEVCR